jgi:hypothetical protein
MQHKLKTSGKEDLVNHRRTVFVRLTDGEFLKEKPTEKDKIPVTPYQGKNITRSEAPLYVPSLDPVRVEGKLKEAK